MKKIWIPALLILFAACNNNRDKADAYGNFEADDIVISSQASGQLLQFIPDEGTLLHAGDTIAIVDTTQLYLSARQIAANIAAIREKLPDAAKQLAVYDQQMDKLQQDINRDENLVKYNAVPKKQLDDEKAQLAITMQQKTAAASTLNTQTKGLLAEIDPLHYQLLETEDKLQKCYVINPINGTVLNTYTKQYEVVQPGKALYDISPVSPIILRAYITEPQLHAVKIGDSVTVKTDIGNGQLQTEKGKITWISSEAEFTPKIIQTKDERANLVYAMKIDVANNGSLKIGMPAEVYFNH
jgi:membrane fusion protein YbhG